MKLRFRQRYFSWLDSYDIYDEDGNTVYVVKGKLSWGHCLHVYDSNNEHIATVKEEIFTFLPKFKMYVNDQYIGLFYKEFSFLKPKYHLDYNGWYVEGNMMEWDYSILDGNSNYVATISKEIFHLTDVYEIDVNNSHDALYVLLVVLAIDAEKCSRNND